MSQGDRSTDQICVDMPLGESALKLPRAGVKPTDYFASLVKGELFGDAIAFMAHLLPKREAVWWGCLCVEYVSNGKLPPVEEAALAGAVRWAMDPSEPNRRAAQALGKAAKASTPAGSVALAAFWSGGSISLPDLPEVPPQPKQSAQAITGALKIAATRLPPDQKVTCQRQFLALAMEVANGSNRWA
ncbi:MAG: hypothetical protein U1D30_15025 [Planctomycetota bacterium]